MFHYVEKCKVHCVTRMEGDAQRTLFEAICKTLTSWLSLSVSAPTDPQEKSERANAIVNSVELLSSLIRNAGHTTRIKSTGAGLDLEDFESTSGNLWEEKEKDPTFIQFLSGDSNHVVRCASLNQLVYKITDPDVSDLTFLRTFLMTYKTFVTPHELFLKLTQRFSIPAELALPSTKVQAIQLRVYNVMRQWVQIGFSDWDQQLCDDVRKWISEAGDPKWADIISGLISKAIILENMRILEDAKCTYFVGVGISVSQSDFLLMDPQVMADQITIFSSELFSRLAMSELVSGAWMKDETKHKAPTVAAMIKAFNALSRWVQLVVLEGQTVKERAKYLTLFVRVLERLFKMNNLDASLSIMSGLRSAAVNRLKFSYELLGKPEAKKLAVVEDVLESTKNYTKLRTHLQSLPSGQPRVPYLGMFMTDITFISEGNLDLLDGLINWKKREMLSNSMEILITCQAESYTNLERLDRVVSFLYNLPVVDEDAMYALSLQREPRNADRGEIP